jgi:hypothetical protein
MMKPARVPLALDDAIFMAMPGRLSLPALHH